IICLGDPTLPLSECSGPTGPGPSTTIPGTTTTTVVPGTTIPGTTIPGTTIPGTTTPGTTTTTTTTTTRQITQPGTVTGTIQQMTYMVSGYVDLLPGAIIVPYVGAGVGMAFISDGVASCGMCSTQFAYQSTVGVGWNVNDNLRFDIETRYYGTTSPGTYNNNNITTTVRARYRLNQRRHDAHQPRPRGGNQQD